MPSQKKTSSVTTIAIEPVCLDIRQAATFMATSPHAVRHLIYTQKLKAFQLGKKLVLPVADLRRYVEQAAV